MKTSSDQDLNVFLLPLARLAYDVDSMLNAGDDMYPLPGKGRDELGPCG